MELQTLVLHDLDETVPIGDCKEVQSWLSKPLVQHNLTCHWYIRHTVLDLAQSRTLT